MRFSAKGEYGVRVMVDLARGYGGGPLSLADIARQQGMPFAYLEQIIGELRQAGLVTARRGRYGGYTLARPPAEITMGAVIRVLEGGISPMVCIPNDVQVDDPVLCVHQNYCTTRVLWIKVRDSIVAALESTTLADLTVGGPPPPGVGGPPAPSDLGLGIPLANECHDLQIVMMPTPPRQRLGGA